MYLLHTCCIIYIHIDGSDFLFMRRSIIFLAGSITSIFNVTINDNAIFEINETFNLVLLSVSPPRSISIVNGTTTVVIVDNDSEC